MDFWGRENWFQQQQQKQQQLEWLLGARQPAKTPVYATVWNLLPGGVYSETTAIDQSFNTS